MILGGRSLGTQKVHRETDMYSNNDRTVDIYVAMTDFIRNINGSIYLKNVANFISGVYVQL